jgi:lycopene cyclase domain-containing protein
MSHFSYLVVLAACLVGTAPLEIVLRTRVYARWRRLLLTLVPTVVIFAGWDVYAIRHRQWVYERHFITGVFLPGRLPLEEFRFFLGGPTCAVLTLDAVRRRRPQWTVGDEP